MGDDVEFSISQFRQAWRLFCGACPSHVADRHGAVEYIFSGLPIPFFNVALVTARNVSAEALQAQARLACAWAADKGVPWMLVVTHEALASGVDAASELDACGLAPAIPLTGMRTAHVAAATRTAPELQVGVAGDDDSCAAVFDVNAAAYRADLESCKPTFGKRSFWDGHVVAVGRVAGTPVASAAVLMIDGCRYVALVATTPDHQRRGYGEAVMRHVLDVAEATHGKMPTVLHATDAGRPIYERMGYETIATHTAFIEQRYLEEH